MGRGRALVCARVCEAIDHSTPSHPLHVPFHIFFCLVLALLTLPHCCSPLLMPFHRPLLTLLQYQDFMLATGDYNCSDPDQTIYSAGPDGTGVVHDDDPIPNGELVGERMAGTLTYCTQLMHTSCTEHTPWSTTPKTTRARTHTRTHTHARTVRHCVVGAWRPYTHTYTHTYTITHTHTHTHGQALRGWTMATIHTHIHTHTHTQLHTHTHTHTHGQALCGWSMATIHTHIHTHIHNYTHTHTHTRSGTAWLDHGDHVHMGDLRHPSSLDGHLGICDPACKTVCVRVFFSVCVRVRVTLGA